ELLEALETIVNQCESSALMSAIARAAIAKAKGD
ncbi:hypothetical protein LCGC14_2149200, partial [marine sediment metagenome]